MQGDCAFAQLGSDCNSTNANLSILYHYVEFSLQAAAEDLSSLADLPDYQTCVRAIEQAGEIPKDDLIAAHQALVQIVTDKFWPTIMALAQHHELDRPTVADLPCRPEYTLQLSGDAISSDGPHDSNPFSIQPLLTHALRPAISAAAVFHPARSLTIAWRNEASASLGGLARLPDDSTAWFKPSESYKEAGLLAEIAVLQRLEKAHRSSEQPLRIPKLLGLVISNDVQQIIGFLQEAITGKMLAECTREDRATNAAKWRMQIQDSARVLHRHGVLWGDVNETNVLIDESRDAWLIDLAGGQVYADERDLEVAKSMQEMEEAERLFALEA